MILSYNHNFLFLKPHKAAGTSMEFALSKFCGEDDIITQAGRETELQLGRKAQNYYFKDLPHLAGAAQLLRERQEAGEDEFIRPHAGPKMARILLGQEKWDALFKWSIVRNPFEVIVSQYAFLAWQSKGGAKEHLTPAKFRQWLLEDTRNITRGNTYFLLEDNQFHKNPDGTYKRALDFYVRYEHFEEDLTLLSQKLNLPENLWNVFKNINAKGKARPPTLTVKSCFADFAEGIFLIEKEAAPILKTFNYDSPKA